MERTFDGVSTLAPGRIYLIRDMISQPAKCRGQDPNPAMEEFEEDSFSEKAVSISYYDTDYNQHVNNISYITWAMESFPHDFLNKKRPTLIDVKWEKQSFVGDNLYAKTFSKKDGTSFMTKIYRTEEDGSESEVFTALTEWTDR